MKPGDYAIIGAAETTELGNLPHISTLELHADAALNALADACIDLSEIDGICCYEPSQLSAYLGIHPSWQDGTSIGGCSWMLFLRIPARIKP